MTTLSFEANETIKTLEMSINNDGVPEINELFSAQLEAPSGGSRIGQTGAVNVTILTNDEAHGQIRFSPVSN